MAEAGGGVRRPRRDRLGVALGPSEPQRPQPNDIRSRVGHRHTRPYRGNPRGPTPGDSAGVATEPLYKVIVRRGRDCAAKPPVVHPSQSMGTTLYRTATAPAARMTPARALLLGFASVILAGAGLLHASSPLPREPEIPHRTLHGHLRRVCHRPRRRGHRDPLVCLGPASSSWC
ncbi:MAG: hypothetical protein MZV70_70235 [Desulfobacterales bacterium]|nr:hypothetical protein [Desulfobacterales bacterium]